MPITEFLEKNARLYPNDVALVEVNPEISQSAHPLGVNTALSSQPPAENTAARSRGATLIPRQTDLQTSCSPAE